MAIFPTVYPNNASITELPSKNKHKTNPHILDCIVRCHILKKQNREKKVYKGQEDFNYRFWYLIFAYEHIFTTYFSL